MNLAVGFFDGVHLGHRRILSRADAALTFLEHPCTVFAPGSTPPLLMSAQRRIAAIAAALGGPEAGPDSVRALPFTSELAAQTPAEFADWLRAAYPGLDTVFCGPNWTFGAGGAGTANTLRELGFQVETVPFVMQDGQPVSSTRIRAAIQAGRLDEACDLLGHPFTVDGELFGGKGLGRTLGYPTLNMRLADGLVAPALGAYAVSTPLGRGVANFGHAPTLGDRAWATPTLEIHVTDGSALPPSPPTTLAVDMLRFLRHERAFASLDELKDQIARDIAAARML